MTKKEIKLLRLYNCMSQKQFAEQIGVGESTVAKVERGIVKVSDFIRSRVLLNFDVSEPAFIAFCEQMGGTLPSA